MDLTVLQVFAGGLLVSLASAQFVPSYDKNLAQAEYVPFSNPQPLDTPILGQYGHSPAVLPSPNITGTGGWKDGLEKAKAFLEQLTLEEKADIVTGTQGPCVGNIAPIPRIGWKGLCLQDGPMGIRNADYASVFVSGVSAASTWDRKVLYDRGKAMAQEFKDKGAHVHLGPVAGPLGRNPYAGRNWEGFAADPYLTGVAMKESIKGIQSVGIQGLQRQPSIPQNLTYDTQVDQESVSSNIEDRTIHELYLWPFVNAIRAGATTVMCSYNRLNGSYACQNSKALNGLLKGELGFQGYVQSDWGATHSGLASIESGLDMNLPGGFSMFGDRWSGTFFGGNITAAVRNGTLPVERLNDMMLRVMTPYFALGQDKNYPTVDRSSVDLNNFTPPDTWVRNFTISGASHRDVRRDHAKLIRQHGADSTILLKNERNALPLEAPKRIFVFGNDAGEVTHGPYNSANFEFGTLAAAGGSGTGRFTTLSTPLQAIQSRVAKDDGIVRFWLNNTLIIGDSAGSDSQIWVYEHPDVCLVFLKNWHEELVERPSLNLDWRANELVEKVASNCNNTVVVTHSGGVNVLPWADHPNVTAILAAHYPGQETGNAIADVLYGTVNPSAKLPYTIAYRQSDYTALPTTSVNTTGPDDWQSYFDEKLEIDYRYFDAHNISVRYEFGFGLSYSTFHLSGTKSQKIAPGGNPALFEPLYEVSSTVTNSGERYGGTVAQLYVTFPDNTPKGTPPKQLRGFQKVFLEKGEFKTATFELMRRDLSYWDVGAQEWVIPQGEFTLSVGFSSRDLRELIKITPLSASN
ncbi:glycoside hydrolase superfamily [Aspergillus pseudocaelatus]|uniref:Probable beta-glucosidase G n=1 Tax=Aspergillus pseudocaelatus TaxID=1825620 RepID=A0ABQ6WNK5_9EURO|nr:glycoside hydrolase superfamily [Aspergillus pseudocaelatus]